MRSFICDFAFYAFRLFLLGMLLQGILKGEIVGNYPEHLTTKEEKRLANNIECAEAMLDEQRWSLLGYLPSGAQKQADYLATYAMVEANYLNIPTPKVVLFYGRRSLGGDYDPETNTIRVNRLHVEDGPEALEIVAHECAHAAQHAIVDGSAGPDNCGLYNHVYIDDWLVERWAQEFENYKTVKSDGYSEYSSQQIEQAARFYARQARKEIAETLGK